MKGLRMSQRLYAAWICILIGLGLVSPGWAQPHQVVQARAVWSQDAAHVGDSLVLAVVADIELGWHIYSDQDQQYEDTGGVSLIPTTIHVDHAPPGLAFGPVVYPEPHHFEMGKFLKAMVFEDQAIFFLPVMIGDTTKPGTQRLVLDLHYQACDDKRCLMPAHISVDTGLQIVGSDVAVTKINPNIFAAYQHGDAVEQEPGHVGQLPVTTEGADVNTVASFEVSQSNRGTPGALAYNFFGMRIHLDTRTVSGMILLMVLAGLGGFLLNFTPCVLPVIPIKIIGLSKVAGSRRRCLLLGASMTFGVVVFWLVIGALVSLVSGFTTNNQLFGYPAFTLTVGIVIAILAVGMCGLFALRLPKFVYGFSPGQDTMVGSFGFGVMTAVLSTPCTGLFLGFAAAWAATQSAPVALLTFSVIGLGMALPYLVLSANPAWVDKMPRTGPASELIKQLMGLLMLAAAAYFIGSGINGVVNDGTKAPSGAYWWVVAIIVVAAGLWLAHQVFFITRRPSRRLACAGLGVLLAVTSLYSAYHLAAKQPQWVYFTEERFQAALDEGNAVVLDFTADWCLNCKVLEAAVLYHEKVLDRLSRKDVVAMKVDITSRKNVDGYKMLDAVGRVTIPLLVVFSADGVEVFKSDAYGVEQVLDAIERATLTGNVASGVDP